MGARIWAGKVPGEDPPPRSTTRDLANESYAIRIGTTNSTERYYRDGAGWVKVSARGRRFRLTAEQVLNHLLPALAGLQPPAYVRVEHRPRRRKGLLGTSARGEGAPRGPGGAKPERIPGRGKRSHAVSRGHPVSGTLAPR